MVGEIITGVAESVTQAAPAVGPAVMEAPSAAIQTVGSVALATGAAAEVPQIVKEVENGVAGAVESVAAVVPPDTLATGPLGEMLAGAENFLAAGSPETALEVLAFGIPNSEATVELDTTSLSGLIEQLQHLAPEKTAALLGKLDGVGIPNEMLDNPEFLSAFMGELGNNLAENTFGKSKKSLAQMSDTFARSARNVIETTRTKLPTDKELEHLKKESAKKAALITIQRLMDSWRVSVMKDKRFTENAQKIAYRKIGLVEKRLMATELIKWDGLSLVKLVTLASAWMQELQEDSLPQPKL